MALGKYSRIDNKKSSYWSTVTVVAFVALCLVGVWMMTSSSGMPAESVDETSQENSEDMKEKVNAATNDNPVQFDDSQGELPEEATKGDSNISANPEETNVRTQENQEEKIEEKVEEKPEEKKPEEKSNEEKPEEKSNDEKPEEKSNEEKPEEKSNEEKPEEKSNEEKPEEKSNEEKPEEKSNEEKPEEKSNEEPKSDDESKSETQDGENKNDDPKTQTDDSNGDSIKQGDAGESTDEKEKKVDSVDSEKKTDKEDSETKPFKDETKPDENLVETNQEKGDATDKEEKVDENENKESDTTSEEKKGVSETKDQNQTEVFPSGAQSELLNESTTQNGSFSTQASESKNEKETQLSSKPQAGYSWKLCNTTAGPDFIPCLDNLQAIKSLHSTKHYEHRERHCPEEPPTCLVPLPEGYKRSIAWPKSREKIWYSNVPHTKLAAVKGHQNWVKVTGEYLTFPGGGTQFKHGALHYIDFLQESVPDIAWGKHSRVILDVGCGVASFGGFLFDRDVLAMSLAPKDEHEAQIQFAVERGIPAISAVMGTLRLPYPGKVFDVVHCARCRVPWHIEGGKLLLELNRLLRPGGLFVWSATPVYQKLPEDVEIWKAMTEMTKKMCWDLVSINKDTVNGIAAATYKKPTSNKCYDSRSEQKPPLCPDSDDPNAAWNVPMEACLHKIPENASERGSQWPEQWPARVEKTPYWLSSSQVGVYGKPAPEDFAVDYEHWKRVVTKSYLGGMGIDWATVRNVMDMRAVYGGFAAALKDMKVWVMNVVPVDYADTLPIIYERGLFGIYHDWCESFSTYPRSYDLLHADHIFSKVKTRCNVAGVFTEVDRILRPEGKLIVRDSVEIINELEAMARSMQWQVRMTFSKEKEGLLCVQKSKWRPTESENVNYAIA